ncbi:PX domain-containing protein EREX [Humulus lupulus]|uniref:PX domain-containing protein EREX n=1 Tax=Humulus lupulus TaxID=3486 RepID=UPI002B400BA7|nr:PX domain-containing protein EREX [Humulus lupulus]
MNLYAHDLSLLDFNYGFSDSIDDSFSLRRTMLNSALAHHDEDFYYDHRTMHNNLATPKKPIAPPSHRHDGTSPLPLGMDWSPPPRKWEGRDSVWPHDPHTGWSYCCVIPSWTFLPKSRGSEPVVFYRVQVGIQSPEGVTTVRGILRRYNDFLKLFSELKKAFFTKDVPPAPPKKLLPIKSQEHLEQRRCALEDWMEKLLSDIDLSRSFQIAAFLELEAAVRSSFNDVDKQSSDGDSSTSGAVPPLLLQENSDMASNYGDEMSSEKSEIRMTHEGVGRIVATDHISEDITNVKLLHLNGTEFIPDPVDSRASGHSQRLSTESIGSESISDADLPGGPRNAYTSVDPDLRFPRGVVATFPSDERHKLNRVLMTLQQRLATAKADMEDLIARLNQEAAVRQYLTTKVKYLEVELETTKQACTENIQQTVFTEKEKFTQMQWDVEEFQRKCMQLELKLKSEEEGKIRAESTKMLIMDENKMLSQELDATKEQLHNLQKHHEAFELKSKTELKLLVKEVRSLRNSQSELKEELSQQMKEKLKLERVLEKEKKKAELANAANEKLLHECEILRTRLEECSVSFLVEEEDKLVLDTSLPSDTMDLLTTSDNRIGLLLAEAQLLAQDMENVDESHLEKVNGNDNNLRKTEDKLRQILTDTLVDNAILRKQVNSVIRCALRTSSKDNDEEEDSTSRRTALSKFLEN